jgi:hypothetical protein
MYMFSLEDLEINFYNFWYELLPGRDSHTIPFSFTANIRVKRMNFCGGSEDTETIKLP